MATFHVESAQPRKSRRRKRELGLPENAKWQDTGCELAPSCLECPLALCKYDDPSRGQRNRKIMRDKEIVKLRGKGLRVSNIAKITNTSDRTVYRIIRRDCPELSDIYKPKLPRKRSRIYRPSTRSNDSRQTRLRPAVQVTAA